MTATVFAPSREQLEVISGEVRNIASSTGVNLINEPMAARTHYFAQHPGNMSFRSRKAAVTNRNFADFAALHRTALGKTGAELPWGTPITMFPTPERSGYWFSYHEAGDSTKGTDRRPHADLRPARVRQIGSRGVPDDDGPQGRGPAFCLRLQDGHGDGRPGARRSLRLDQGRAADGPNPLRTEVDVSGQAWQMVHEGGYFDPVYFLSIEQRAGVLSRSWYLGCLDGDHDWIEEARWEAPGLFRARTSGEEAPIRIQVDLASGRPLGPPLATGCEHRP